MQQAFLSPVHFSFLIKRLPHVSFYVQGINIPGLSSSEIETPSPFKGIFLHGGKLIYDDLIVTVRMDEDLQAYKEIHDWIVSYTAPEKFSQYNKDAYSDATLIISSSKQNPNVQFLFKDIYPTSISSIGMNVTEADVNYVSCDINFKINSFTFELLKKQTPIGISGY